ncbi:MAG: sigma-70 family RNA polymerase sigma factor [Alphaproteobacteria bacterium]|nr:sigma-70 family RNA polymerase sigma factor [Alphaproteobacteria bacterium]
MAMYEKETDEGLMERIKSGDHQAFSLLVRRHTQRFYACAFRLCACRNMSEDIVQDAFLKLWENPDRWKSGKGAQFTTWFYRVVINLTIDTLRKTKKYSGIEALDYIKDNVSGQEEQLVINEQQRILESMIQKLPERQRIALNLCFYEGLSNKEAAGVLKIGVKGLESLLMRAKKSLRDDLQRQGIL